MRVVGFSPHPTTTMAGKVSSTSELIEIVKDTLERIRFESVHGWPLLHYYPVVIKDCMPNVPSAFSRAKIWLGNIFDMCEDKAMQRWPFTQLTDIMENPLKALQQSLKKDEKPTAEIKCLLSFLKDKEKHSKVLLEMKNKKKETEEQTAVVMAVHLFSQLYPSHTFALNIKSDVEECPCGCIDVKENREKKTGLGGAEVWHGHADILLHSRFVIPATVAAPVEPKLQQTSISDDSSATDLSDDDWDQIPVEVKGRSKDVLDHDWVTGQIISQTIVSSFANAAKKNGLDDSRIKSKMCLGLGCTLDQVAVYYYDCEKDLLVTRSSHIKLWKNFDGQPELSSKAILELWLILNFQPELSQEAAMNFPKSNFLSLVSEKALKCYKASVIGKYIPSTESNFYHRKLYSDVMVEEFPLKYCSSTGTEDV